MNSTTPNPATMPVPGAVPNQQPGTSPEYMDISMLPYDKTHQTRMWQQNQYLTDSGIHSALGTHTPSVSSKLGPEEMDQDDGYKPNVGQACQWSNGPMSVFQSDLCLMSPGTPGGGSVILGGEAMADGVVPPPSGPLSSSLPEIDTDEAASAIPDLVKLIKDEDDPVVIYQASMMVFQLSKSGAVDALIASDGMLNCIVSALSRTDDPETIRFLAGTFYNMSQKQSGLQAIFAANSVPSLVNLLSSSTESVLFYAITTLHNLLLHQEGAKSVVRQSGCLQKMVTLLQKNNIKFLTICTDCLQILAYGHQESKMAVLSSGGPAELVRILRNYQYEKLLWTTTRILKVLSVCTANKPAIIEAGGMEALTRHLHSCSQRLVLNCLWTLRNLSDAATRLDSLHPLLQALVHILCTGDVVAATCAAGIVSNLTCNNHSNKVVVHKLHGVEALLRALGEYGDHEEIVEPCVCALRHLTSRHEEADQAQQAVVRHRAGLPIVARLLHPLVVPQQQPQMQVSWSQAKAVVGLLRNLTLYPANHGPLRDIGFIGLLVGLLVNVQQEIVNRRLMMTNGQQQQTQSQHPMTVVQNVRLEEIVEAACASLQAMAKDANCRLTLLRGCGAGPGGVGKPQSQPTVPAAGVLNPFVQLLFSPHEAIQRVAAGLLHELAQEREGLEAVACAHGAAPRLNELAHSRNEAVSTYAAAIMLRLTEDRRHMQLGGGQMPQPTLTPLLPPGGGQGPLSAMLGPPPPPQQQVGMQAQQMQYPPQPGQQQPLPPHLQQQAPQPYTPQCGMDPYTNGGGGSYYWPPPGPPQGGPGSFDPGGVPPQSMPVYQYHHPGGRAPAYYPQHQMPPNTLLSMETSGYASPLEPSPIAGDQAPYFHQNGHAGPAPVVYHQGPPAQQYAAYPPPPPPHHQHLQQQQQAMVHNAHYDPQQQQMLDPQMSPTAAAFLLEAGPTTDWLD